MMTLKEYAESRSVSYETVRVQTTRYKEELKGHIKTEDKRKVLDEFACDFLDQHRLKRNVVVKYDNNDMKQELEKVREEKERLKDAIILLQKELQDMTKQNSTLLEDRARSQALLLLADKEHDQLESMQTELKKTQEVLLSTQKDLTAVTKDLAAATKELGSYNRTIFGLYKKV
ncbi:hypothetical protein SAMN04487770_12737 [Butyrivibrio sp. ob235]|uniref:hypothetical protein n=1 Tax=Butyrivibrio sp. ob235 TaxID=1761780 RepID=UPI0008BA4609|nr:hypothetical protein [Butyrivibrio sp. ob235]SEM15635.1 hypothetical protein SAMN04487770_12737 [Butyrivibrio sp. ob235]